MFYSLSPSLGITYSIIVSLQVNKISHDMHMNPHTYEYVYA